MPNRDAASLRKSGVRGSNVYIGFRQDTVNPAGQPKVTVNS